AAVREARRDVLARALLDDPRAVLGRFSGRRGRRGQRGEIEREDHLALPDEFVREALREHCRGPHRAPTPQKSDHRVEQVAHPGCRRPAGRRSPARWAGSRRPRPPAPRALSVRGLSGPSAPSVPRSNGAPQEPAMLDILPSPDHVAAFRIGGTLDADDYRRIVAHLEATLARHETIGVLADMTGF